MTRYRLLGVTGRGDFETFNIRVRNALGQTQLWTRRKLRKETSCCECSIDMKVGTVAFGEGAAVSLNRRERICLGCVLREIERQHDAALARLSAGRSGKKGRGSLREKKGGAS